MRTHVPVPSPAPSRPPVNGEASRTLRSGAVLFISVGVAFLLIALGFAAAEARLLARSALADGVVRSGEPAGPRACVAMVHFKTLDGKEFVHRQARQQSNSRGSRPPQCTVGEIVPLAYHPGDPGGTVTVAGRGYHRAGDFLGYGGLTILLGLWLRRQASKSGSRAK